MTPDEQAKYQRDFNRFQRRKESLYSGKVNKAIRQQIKTFIERYLGNPTNATVIVFDTAPLVNVIREIYVDTGLTWGAKVYTGLNRELRRQKAQMPIGLSEFLRDAILNYFDMDLLSDVSNINNTTRDNILSALRIAAERGLGIDDTIALIYDVAIPVWRSRLIARTETVTAANQGAALAAAKTGISLNKIWISAVDNRTRHDHLLVNRTTIDFNEPFIVGGFPMMQPGDRGTKSQPTPAKEICNCRCTVGYEPKRDNNGRIVMVSQ
jgi:hypothetical protein